MKKKYPMTELTMRDYFAAKAMQSLIIANVDEWPDDITALEADLPSVSKAAYEIADSMMEAREA